MTYIASLHHLHQPPQNHHLWPFLENALPLLDGTADWLIPTKPHCVVLSLHIIFLFQILVFLMFVFRCLGPAPINSINGTRYFILFLDDCTKFIWIYFIHQKSDVLTIFKQFHTMVETQFNVKIKCLQTDWGGEFRNVSSHLQTLGIQHRVSCPHTQEQNGAPERRNRIIVEKGLSLLAHASLPLSFWEPAFYTAVYLSNRTITPILNHSSPYRCLYGRPPDYGFLKTFGCLCFPFLRPYNKHKF